MKKHVLFFILLLSANFLLLFSVHNLKAQAQKWKGKTEVKNGINYIHNPKQGMWDNDPTKKLIVEKIFSIGSMNADDEYLFSWVKDITTDSAGNIYACDSKEHRIQVYDKNGKYLRTIGRKGQGPGDLMRPMAVRVDRDGKIFVQDDLNYRISIFKPNGKFDHSFKYRQIAGENLEIDLSGNVLLNHALFGLPKGQTIPPIVTVYNLKGNVKKQFGKPLLILKKDGYGRPYYAYNGFSKQKDGTLIVHFSYTYLIHIYKKGQLFNIIEKDSPIFTKPEIVETVFKATTGEGGKVKSVTQRSGIRKILPLPDGSFVAVIFDKGKDFKEKTIGGRDFVTCLDLFNSEGKFLKSYSWDWQQYGLLEHVDEHGYFYTNRGDSEIVPGVTKWKVSFE